jgi:DmsE family decaheme c-type cytochrome
MRNKKTPIPFIPGVAVVDLLIGMLLLTSGLARAADSPQDCADCHEAQVAAFAGNPHMTIDAKGWAKKANAKYSCQACHGDATKHIEDAEGKDIFTFKATDLANVKTKKCLACHQGTHFNYLASNHGKAGMACTGCHSIHSKTLAKDLGTKSCYSCHEDIFAQFKYNERHRLQEGILECTSCHNPHVPATRERLGGFKQEACFTCHRDKQGPFLYEHGSQRIEGCAVCHEVHGSQNRHMLIQQNVAELCFSCHTVVPSFHSRFTPDYNCVVCHSTIHGSNTNEFFIK